MLRVDVDTNRVVALQTFLLENPLQSSFSCWESSSSDGAFSFKAGAFFGFFGKTASNLVTASSSETSSVAAARSCQKPSRRSTSGPRKCRPKKKYKKNIGVGARHFGCRICVLFGGEGRRYHEPDNILGIFELHHARWKSPLGRKKRRDMSARVDKTTQRPPFYSYFVCFSFQVKTCKSQ